MKTRKMCIVRVLSGMFVAFFVASCSSDQGVTLRSGETSSVEKAQVVGTTVQEATDPDAEEINAVNRWYTPDTDHGSLADARASHRPGMQQSSIATLRTELATAMAMDSDGMLTDIARDTGYQADGDTEETVTDEQRYQRGRYVYANQPALDKVGTAFAYIRDANQPSPQALGTAFASDTLQDGTSDGLNLGRGSNISVITNTRFDPTHPSFDSSESNAQYDTLTRFLLGIEGDDINTIADVIDLFFANDRGELVQVYNTDFDSGVRAYVTIPVPALNDGTNVVAFDTISRNDFDGNADIRNALLTFMQGLLGGNRAMSPPTTIGVSLNINNDDYIELTGFDNNQDYNHIGRMYGVTSNIVSYQIVADPTGTSFQDDDNDDISGLTLANDAQMGLLALINGRRNLEGISTFADLKIATHGIAPEARLRVFSSFTANNSRFNGTDLIYRARGIDVARDRDDDGELIADDDRNIVLVQNNIVHADRSEAATQDNINDVVGVGSATMIDDDYKDIYDALKLGVADTNMQDIYVFAAADARGTQKDAGLLASIAGAQEDSGDGSLTRLFAEYSLVVAAVEADADAYCGSVVAAFCITAPGTYTYRGRGSDNTYGGGDDTLETIGTPTSNAAASLVAGGLAVLMNVFGDQITSQELVSRVLSTAAKRFDLDGTPGNDYTASDGSANTERYGVGMLDLECASRPNTTASSCRRVCAGDTPFENSARNRCVPMCAAGEGSSASSGGFCIAAGDATPAQCANAMRVRLAGGTCAAMCGDNNAPTSSTDRQCIAATTACMNGADGYNSGTNTCVDAANVRSAAECAVFTGGKNVYRPSMGCVTADACRGNNRERAVDSQNECVNATADACFQDDGFGFDSNAMTCVTAAAGTCSGRYEFDMAVMRCVASFACPQSGMTGTIVNSTGNGCVANCPANEGLSAMSGAGRRCIAAASATAAQCGNAGQVRLAGTGCVMASACRTGNRAVNQNECVAASPRTCSADGGQVLLANMGCVTPSACRGSMGAVNANECVTASAQTCFNDEGRGFSSSSCQTATAMNCMAGGFGFDGTNTRCVILDTRTGIPSLGLTGITDEATAKALFTTTPSTFADDAAVAAATDTVKIRNEYQNQPSLDIVGAADAYARNADSSTISTHGLNLGQGSQISVITNNRFDPTHPEFSSSDSDASYDTLTRFVLVPASGQTNRLILNTVIPLFFDNDSDELVQVYSEGLTSGQAYLSIPVPALNTMAFEDISRNNFDANGGAAIRTAFQTFIQSIMGGDRVTVQPNPVPVTVSFDAGQGYYIEINGGGTSGDNINLTRSGSLVPNRAYNHIGRVYGDASNIASYQIVATSSTEFQIDNGNLSSSGNGITAIAEASDADMGLLALINGLLDPSRSDTAAKLAANTHGIAPLAYLHVLTSFKAGQTNFNGTDLIYRARGIDVGRDRDGDGNLIADDDRNIVLIQNTIAVTSRGFDVELTQPILNAFAPTTYRKPL